MKSPTWNCVPGSVLVKHEQLCSLGAWHVAICNRWSRVDNCPGGHSKTAGLQLTRYRHLTAGALADVGSKVPIFPPEGPKPMDVRQVLQHFS